MAHGDSFGFASGSKREVYQQLLSHAEALFADQRNWVCNLSNASSLIYHALLSLPAPSNAVNWCGFYVVDPANPQRLVLGPFQGKVACQTITIGKGVCGTAAAAQETQVVPDVDKFPGHIACDAASRSEIVVPIVRDGRTVAVIDIDCGEVGGFDEQDREGLERVAKLIERSCDF